MSRHMAWIFLGVMTLAASAPLEALNYEVGGCRTGSTYVNFATISAAVSAVPAGATILICAGVYPEQVTITHPLTLKGIPSGNANRAVIVASANGNFAPNVTSINGPPFYAQILIENVTPAGVVNLTGITIDGNGINFDCPSLSPQHLAGVFYASGTSGTVNQVTARNQLSTSASGACGEGIWAENGAGTQTVNITNSSVRNIGDSGITATSSNSSGSVAIKTNFVIDTGVGFTGAGIADFSAGQVSGNVVTHNPTTAIITGGPMTMQGNTVADLTWAFDISGSDITVQSNYISNVQVGIAIEGGSPIVKSNTITHTSGCALTFRYNSNNATITGNHINDSPYAFANLSGPLPSHNVLFNVDSVQGSTTTCP